MPTVVPAPRELRRRLAHLDLREPEVEDFHLARRRQHQVRGFQIAVDDAGGVRGGERVGYLCDEAGDLGHRQRPAGEASGERLALVVRHRDERLAVVVADFVDRGDVRVIERAGGARLPQQAGGGVRMADGVRGQELQRNPALEVRVLGKIDRTHPAGADVAEDPVVGDGGADHAREILLPSTRPSSSNNVTGERADSLAGILDAANPRSVGCVGTPVPLP